MENIKPRLKEGQVVTCLPKDHKVFMVKGRGPTLFHGGCDKYGKKGRVSTIRENIEYDDGLGHSLHIRWDDGGSYLMREGEFVEYYDDSKYYDSSRFHMSEISIPNVSSDKLLLLL